MSLILAIEPDRRQASKLAALARGPLNVDMVVGETTERAFQAIGGRVPDLVMTSLLLSPKDEAALADRLRELGATGAHVQTLVIPMLGASEAESRPSGLFSRLRKGSGRANRAGGCDPAVFGAQILEYLERAAAERAALAAAQADLDAVWADEPPAMTAPAAATVALPAVAQADLDAAWADEPPAVTAPAAATVALPAVAQTDLDATWADEPPAMAAPTATTVAASASATVDVPTLLRPLPSLEEDLSVEPTFEVVSAPAAPVVPQREPMWAGLLAAPAEAVGGPEETAPDDDWEEISLDVETGLAPAADIDAEALDLDAYVRQLYAETAAAEPAIPTIDLGALSVEADEDLTHWAPAEARLAETPSIDAALEFHSFATAPEMPAGPPSNVPFEAESRPYPLSVFDDEPAASELELSAFIQEALAPPVPTAWASSSSLSAEAPSLPASTAPLSWSASSWPASPSSSSPAPSSSSEPMPSTAMLGSGWLDVLSAIRRDIHQLRKDESPPAPVSQPAQPPPLAFELSTGLWAVAQSTDVPAVELEEASSTDQAIEDVAPVTAPAPVALLPTLATLEAALSATLEVRMPTPATVLETPSRAPVEVLALAALEVARPATIETLPVFKPLPTLEEAEAAISAVVFHGKAPDRVAVPVVGSWGFFDPQHLELGALLAKLNELSRDASHTLRVGR